MLHDSFKINKQSFNAKELESYASELLTDKEGSLKEIGQFLLNWIGNSNTITVQTSGSTGKPKEITLLKEHMVNSAIATGSFFGCKENTKALLCLSANYIAGKMMLVRAMVLGWDIYLVEPASSPLENLDKVFDFVAMVPLQVENSLAQLYKVKQLIIGGAPVSMELYSKLQDISTQCFATYGMTETITHIAVKKLNNCIGIKETLFKALPNVSISQDKRDCLVITAPKVSKEKIVTNDIVKLYSETSFEWLGRFDNVVNSGGVKLFPEQIEEKLSQLIKLPFFISSLPDKKLGQKLILLIESSVELDLSKSDFQKVGLSTYQIPKEIYTIKEFLKTETGKVQRKQTITLLS